MTDLPDDYSHVVDLSSDIGWERLELIVEIRLARDVGEIRYENGQVQVRGISSDLRERMNRHRDLIIHALTYDQKDNEP